MFIRYIFSATFLLLILIGNAFSIEKQVNFRFQYLGIENGLPQNTINAIEKDCYGYIWFGTNNGISRYDGYSFESFKSDKNSMNSLPDNMIHSIEQSKDNLLWIGSSKGLSYFNPYNNEIINFAAIDSMAKNISKVTTIVSWNERIWVGTANNGLFLIEKTNGGKYQISKHFFSQDQGISDDNINIIYVSKSGKLFVGTQNGFYVYDPENNNFFSNYGYIKLPVSTYVTDIFESSSGDFYFSTNNGLIIYWKGNPTPDYFVTDPQNRYSIAHNIVTKVREAANGEVLVATLGGLQRFDTYSSKFFSYPEEGPENYKLNNQFINTLFCDKIGNVWIGTAGGGINRLDLKSNTFHHYTYSNKNVNSLSSNYITSIIRGEDGNIWVGSWGMGLNKIKTNNNKISIERINETNSNYKNQLVNSFVSAMVSDPRGFLLVATEGGLSTLDLNTKKFTTLLTPDNMSNKLTEIGCVILDSKNYYWLGTRNGLFRFPANSIRQTKDEAYTIRNLQYFCNVRKDKTSLPGNYIISLTEDSKGNIWIGTYGNGVACSHFNDSGKLVCRNFSQDDGLSNNVIYGILEDNSENIWLSTDYGLSMYNVKTNKFRIFYKQDGLLNNQFYWSASYKCDNGILYFGGTEGLDYFNPEKIFEFNHRVIPKLSKLKIYGNEINPGSKLHNKVVLNKPICATDTIWLVRGNTSL